MAQCRTKVCSDQKEFHVERFLEARNSELLKVHFFHSFFIISVHIFNEKGFNESLKTPEEPLLIHWNVSGTSAPLRKQEHFWDVIIQ